MLLICLLVVIIFIIIALTFLFYQYCFPVGGTTTIIDFPEGTGSPFEVGDVVSLTINGTAHQDIGTLANAYVGIITDVGVLSVNKTAGN